MVSRLNPYLSFSGNARTAMEFYKSVFGGTLETTTFGEGNMAQDPSDKDKIMHSMLTASNGFVLMGSDTPAHMEFKPGNTMTVSLSGDDEVALQGYWKQLRDGAKSVGMELQKAPWGDSFGMLNDKFGTPWMVNITAAR